MKKFSSPLWGTLGFAVLSFLIFFFNLLLTIQTVLVTSYKRYLQVIVVLNKFSYVISVILSLKCGIALFSKPQCGMSFFRVLNDILCYFDLQPENCKFASPM